MRQMASRSGWFGRSIQNISSNRPLRRSSGGNCVTSLAVATTNTGEVRSWSQDRNVPNTREAVPPTVVPELRLSANPFFSSSNQSTQGAMASPVAMTERRLLLDCPTRPANRRPASSLSSGRLNTVAVALAVSDLPVPGMPTINNPLGLGRP